MAHKGPAVDDGSFEDAPAKVTAVLAPPSPAPFEEGSEEKSYERASGLVASGGGVGGSKQAALSPSSFVSLLRAVVVSDPPRRGKVDGREEWKKFPPPIYFLKTLLSPLFLRGGGGPAKNQQRRRIVGREGGRGNVRRGQRGRERGALLASFGESLESLAWVSSTVHKSPLPRPGESFDGESFLAIQRGPSLRLRLLAFACI